MSGRQDRQQARKSGFQPPVGVDDGSFLTRMGRGGNDNGAAARHRHQPVELHVIGRRGRRIPRSEALAHVAGYMNGNDVSARDWQLEKPGKQWLLGKTPDTFAPTGPWLVTADEVPDSRDLAIALRLNGQTMQNSTTRELIFGVDELIAYVSQVVTLEPGDIIFTGTPPGVGMARKPPVFLKTGDVCEVEIAGLGVLRNPVVTGD